VALTKSDLVDSDTLELVRLEAEEFLRGSFLENAPLIPVSATTGAGLEELKRALREAAANATAKDAARYFRLPIDRAFAMKGFGSVVTGTLISGSVGAGDEVELFPSGERLRVRGVQSGGKVVERAMPGQRTAVNLAGIDHSALKRGMVLTTAGKFRNTRRIDARLELLASARKMKQGMRVHFHTGTAETIAESFFHGQKELAPGRSAFANLKLQDEILVLPGDRFIVRQFSPVVTIGGGVVLNPLARRPMLRDTGRVAFLETLEGGNREEILATMTERSLFGLGYEEMVAHTAWMDNEIHGAAKRLSAAGRVKTVSPEPLVLVSQKVFEDVRKKILEKVEKFQKENPLLPGILREDLRSSLGRRVRAETFRAALEELVAQKKLETPGELVKKTGSEITLQPEEAKAKDQIEAAFASAGLAVPSVKEVLAKLAVEAKRAEKLLHILLREKNLVRVSPELIFHRQALSYLREQLASYKSAKGGRISVPVFKELTGITRKYAIPLLEYLDRERVTRREGDERVIL
jgi:selenocysteine-specific elongation factor